MVGLAKFMIGGGDFVLKFTWSKKSFQPNADFLFSLTISSKMKLLFGDIDDWPRANLPTLMTLTSMNRNLPIAQPLPSWCSTWLLINCNYSEVNILTFRNFIQYFWKLIHKFLKYPIENGWFSLELSEMHLSWQFKTFRF